MANSINEERREKSLDWAILAHRGNPQTASAPTVLGKVVVETAKAFEKYLEGAEEAE